MNGEFKRYIKEQDEQDTIAEKLRDLSSNNPNIDDIKVSDDRFYVGVYFHNQYGYGKGSILQVFKYPDGSMTLGIKFPGDGRRIEQPIPTTSGEIEKIYDYVKRVTDDPILFFINSDSKHFIPPLSKEEQERVVADDPRNITYIKNLDPEIEKKYRHLKSLNKAGIL